LIHTKAQKNKMADKDKITKPIEKKFYDIKLEVLCPCVITYRIFAEDENVALLNIDKQTPKNVKPDIRRKRNIKATVYDSGTNNVKITKAFRV